uniref:Family with sequence similarity 124 member B n=1 Tax=Leptobrachium leishanense TaxID=445787 RepID=A0A8C5M2J6_9ANUR
MDERTSVLPLTIHLLTSPENSQILKRAVDKFLHDVCPDVLLFQVSERTAPTQHSESPKKRFSFPGVSVTVFLREDLGEDRISVLHSFFHLPPWNKVNAELKHLRHGPINQTIAGYYCLDVDMPVWGIRQVHYGMEIVRLTLYCSFENYEDAVALYELILQMAAIAEKPGFCFFTLHRTKYTSIQLSLKQLPPGTSVQVKEACALQFAVQEIGQLVPLLPYPCVPISDTRWQTQDYDGNKILLLVTENSTVTHNHCNGKTAQAPHTSPCNPQLSKSRRPNEEMESKIRDEKTEIRPYLTLDHREDHRETICGCSDMDSPSRRLYVKETETNVDTGYSIVKQRSQQTIVKRFSRHLPKSSISEEGHVRSSDSNGSQDSSSGTPKAPSTHTSVTNIHFDIEGKRFSSEETNVVSGKSREQEEEFFI